MEPGGTDHPELYTAWEAADGAPLIDAAIHVRWPLDAAGFEETVGIRGDEPGLENARPLQDGYHRKPGFHFFLSVSAVALARFLPALARVAIAK